MSGTFWCIDCAYFQFLGITCPVKYQLLSAIDLQYIYIIGISLHIMSVIGSVIYGMMNRLAFFAANL